MCLVVGGGSVWFNCPGGLLAGKGVWWVWGLAGDSYLGGWGLVLWVGPVFDDS